MTIDPWNLILEWWEDYQADPRSDAENIESGLRKQQTASKSSSSSVDPSVRSSLQTATCQYWVKGLPNVCIHWDSVNMVCGYKNSSEDIQPNDIPTGNATGGCDGLGRRQWCNRYKSPVDQVTGETINYDPEKYVCILPCIERSGSGRIIRHEEGIQIIPWTPNEIAGYNPDNNNVGQCDNNGMGRGKEGFNQEFIENLQLLPPVCKHYKPHMIGFGAVDPRPYHGNPPSSMWKGGQTYIPRTLKKLHDGSVADPLVMMNKRLPFTFKVYNQRAQFQKCAWWDADFGGVFRFDDYGADPSYFQIQIDQNAESYCMLRRDNNTFVKDYTDIDSDNTDIPWVLQNVWAKGGTVVCNGAKPECPCYTGSWVFCRDRNMQDGMRISADQLFELRFWASDWSSQNEYDRFYEAKPGITNDGFGDITTADIYTFTKWKKDESEYTYDEISASDSRMKGNKHHMCMPAPLHMHEYDHDVYISIDAITYPKHDDYLGTTSISEVAYPTLVKELDEPDNLYPNILVIYPYATIDPWDIVACDQEDYVEYSYHNHNLMYDKPKISVVGQCVRNKRIWAINASHEGVFGGLSTLDSLHFMKSYIRAQLIPDVKYESFCRNVEELITESDAGGSAGIVEGQTDKYGFFILEGLELITSGDNDIFVICEFDGGDYPLFVYRYRKVKSRYFGALITQSSFNHEHVGDVWYNTTPSHFTPAGEINGSVNAIGGEVVSVIPCCSHYQHGIFSDVAYYSYCFNVYSEEEADLDQWVQIGPTGYIWAELPDINISYLFGFEIVEASISPKNSGTADNPKWPSLCNEDGYEDSISINLKVANTERKQIPASAVLLKYEKDGEQQPRSFFNKDWKLRIKYKFVKIENEQASGDNAEVYWPSFQPGGVIQFKVPPYEILFDAGSSKFIITEIGGVDAGSTASVMALVVDQEEGRLQAVAVSKMLMMGVMLTCRSIDIFYAYKALATAYDLEPSSGFFTWRGSPKVNPSTSSGLIHYRKAKCGDHECTPGNCIGPVWFPFNNCTTVDYYNVLNGAAQCTMPISEGSDSIKVMGFGAWRYCMAEEFKAWVTPGGNWAASCGTSFYYHYSKISSSSMQFAGFAEKKGKVDDLYYRFMGWTLPPFGNTGRTMVERWLLRDYASFYDLRGPSPVPTNEYMPLVLDREDLIDDLDAFANPGISSHPSLQEPFSHRSVLSTLTASWVNEELVTDERRRFEDIIEPEYHASCMYPWPALDNVGGGFRTIRYKFKSDDLAWAWPEYWKPIERGVGSDEFKWLKLSAQNYYFDLNKARHRFVTDEGAHTVIFKSPTTTNLGGVGDEYGDGSMVLDSPNNLACVCLDGVHWRYFKLEYESYTSGYVDWVDESVSGEDGGSGGSGSIEGNGNIYEEANNGRNSNGGSGPDPKWIHDFDTLFESDASIELNENRKALLGTDLVGGNIYGYYNRGLVAKIPKNKLNQLPMEELSSGIGQLIDGNISLGIPYNGSAVFAWGPDDQMSSATRLIITGVWGTSGTLSEQNLVNLCKPSIFFNERQKGVMNSVCVKAGRSGWYLSPIGGRKETYSLEFEFSKYPDRIMHPSDYYELTLSSVGHEYIQITDVKLYCSKYVTKSEEVIKVWEQKFYVSTLNISNAVNADGPDTKTYRDGDRNGKNAGQYLPAEDVDLWNTENTGSAISKTVMVSAGKFYGMDDDEDIPVTLENLKTVEREEQMALYEEAAALDVYDEVYLAPILPPDVDYFTTKVLGATGLNVSACKLKYAIVDWKHNTHQHSLNQKGDFFSPGGHYFKWSDQYFKTRCYIFGPIETVYLVAWVHHRHAEGDGSEIGYATNNAGASYAGWARLEYYEGRLWSLGLLGQSETGQPTDVLTGAKNQVYTRS